ncbi:sialidase family protein [Streptobacillus felis]
MLKKMEDSKKFRILHNFFRLFRNSPFSRNGGNGNWHSSRMVYYDQLIWAALIHKSKDGGETWNRTHKFDKLNNELFINHTPDNAVKALLGGVGTGIVMKDGTLVMPVQTSHESPNRSGKKPIGATLMYSRDNGKTWKMPEINNEKILMTNGSSLENMIFEIDNKLVITGRGTDTGTTLHRWAYYTEDMGQTWNKFTPLHGFQPVTSQATQGSTLYVTLPSGKKVILVSAPNGNNDNWQRGNLALWALSGKDPSQKKQITVYREGSGNRFGAGYSSLAYKGGNLFVAYEDGGDISVKNLTEFINEIENAATEWNLEDERSKDIEKVRSLDSLSEKQKEKLIAAMMEENDRAFTEALVLNNELNELDKEAEKYAEELKKNPEALASNIRKFNISLEGLQGEERDKLIKVLAVRALKSKIDDATSKFNEVIDFNPYKSIPQKFLYTRRDIIENDNRIFASYGKKLGLTKNYINENDFKLGYNHDIKNMKVGGFVEVTTSKDNAQNISVGGMFKATIEDKYTFRNFARYRYQILNDVKIGGENADDEVDNNNKIDRHNIDVYTSAEARFSPHPIVEITPKAGILLTYSHDTLLDEDVRLDRRVSASADFSVKAEAKYKNFKFKVKPEILVSDNTQYISQSNLSEKKEKIEGKIFEYNMQVGIGAEFKGAKINFDLDFNDISRDYTNYELNFSAGYNW